MTGGQLHRSDVEARGAEPGSQLLRRVFTLQVLVCPRCRGQRRILGSVTVILGDVTHVPLQLFYPEWRPSFDSDPELSARTRSEVFDRIEQQGLKVAAGHYPYPSIGGIVRVEGKRRWRPMSHSDH